MSPTARASLVIPAHDEAAVIPRCLAALVATSSAPESLDVVVVANGCTDRTASVAREFSDRLPGLRVVERREAGKIGALNAGDRAATSYPRIYLDADIELGPGALDALVDALDTDQVRVGAPHVQFDLEGCSAGVRSFYRVFGVLPYASDNLIGLGVYGLSRNGRARFEAFPDVIADDLFVDRLFAPSERTQSPGAFVVRAPRSLGGLLDVRTRVARGNAELARTDPVGRAPLPATDAGGSGTAPSTRSTVRALVGIVARRPVAVLDVATYVGVTLVARVRARRSTDAWLRDESTR